MSSLLSRAFLPSSSSVAGANDTSIMSNKQQQEQQEDLSELSVDELHRRVTLAKANLAALESYYDSVKGPVTQDRRFAALQTAKNHLADLESQLSERMNELRLTAGDAAGGGGADHGDERSNTIAHHPELFSRAVVLCSGPTGTSRRLRPQYFVPHPSLLHNTSAHYSDIGPQSKTRSSLLRSLSWYNSSRGDVDTSLSPTTPSSSSSAIAINVAENAIEMIKSFCGVMTSNNSDNNNNNASSSSSSCVDFVELYPDGAFPEEQRVARARGIVPGGGGGADSSSSSTAISSSSFAAAQDADVANIAFLRWYVLSFNDVIVFAEVVLHPDTPIPLIVALIEHAPRQLLTAMSVDVGTALIARLVLAGQRHSASAFVSQLPTETVFTMLTNPLLEVDEAWQEIIVRYGGESNRARSAVAAAMELRQQQQQQQDEKGKQQAYDNNDDDDELPQAPSCPLLWLCVCLGWVEIVEVLLASSQTLVENYVSEYELLFSAEMMDSNAAAASHNNSNSGSNNFSGEKQRMMLLKQRQRWLRLPLTTFSVLATIRQTISTNINSSDGSSNNKQQRNVSSSTPSSPIMPPTAQQQQQQKAKDEDDDADGGDMTMTKKASFIENITESAANVPLAIIADPSSALDSMFGVSMLPAHSNTRVFRSGRLSVAPFPSTLTHVRALFLGARACGQADSPSAVYTNPISGSALLGNSSSIYSSSSSLSGGAGAGGGGGDTSIRSGTAASLMTSSARAASPLGGGGGGGASNPKSSSSSAAAASSAMISSSTAPLPPTIACRSAIWPPDMSEPVYRAYHDGACGSLRFFGGPYGIGSVAALQGVSMSDALAPARSRSGRSSPARSRSVSPTVRQQQLHDINNEQQQAKSKKERSATLQHLVKMAAGANDLADFSAISQWGGLSPPVGSTVRCDTPFFSGRRYFSVEVPLFLLMHQPFVTEPSAGRSVESLARAVRKIADGCCRFGFCRGDFAAAGTRHSVLGENSRGFGFMLVLDLPRTMKSATLRTTTTTTTTTTSAPSNKQSSSSTTLAASPVTFVGAASPLSSSSQHQHQHHGGSKRRSSSAGAGQQMNRGPKSLNDFLTQNGVERVCFFVVYQAHGQLVPVPETDGSTVPKIVEFPFREAATPTVASIGCGVDTEAGTASLAVDLEMAALVTDPASVLCRIDDDDEDGDNDSSAKKQQQKNNKAKPKTASTASSRIEATIEESVDGFYAAATLGVAHQPEDWPLHSVAQQLAILDKLTVRFSFSAHPPCEFFATGGAGSSSSPLSSKPPNGSPFSGSAATMPFFASNSNNINLASSSVNLTVRAVATAASAAYFNISLRDKVDYLSRLVTSYCTVVADQQLSLHSVAAARKLLEKLPIPESGRNLLDEASRSRRSALMEAITQQDTRKETVLRFFSTNNKLSEAAVPAASSSSTTSRVLTFGHPADVVGFANIFVDIKTALNKKSPVRGHLIPHVIDVESLLHALSHGDEPSILATTTADAGGSQAAAIVDAALVAIRKQHELSLHEERVRLFELEQVRTKLDEVKKLNAQQQTSGGGGGASSGVRNVRRFTRGASSSRQNQNTTIERHAELFKGATEVGADDQQQAMTVVMKGGEALGDDDVFDMNNVDFMGHRDDDDDDDDDCDDEDDVGASTLRNAAALAAAAAAPGDVETTTATTEQQNRQQQKFRPGTASTSTTPPTSAANNTHTEAVVQSSRVQTAGAPRLVPRPPPRAAGGAGGARPASSSAPTILPSSALSTTNRNNNRTSNDKNSSPPDSPLLLLPSDVASFPFDEASEPFNIAPIDETLPFCVHHVPTGAVVASPLCTCIRVGWYQLARQLATCRVVDVDAADSLGYTPAMLCVVTGQSQLLRYLVFERDASLVGKNDDGYTAMHLAILLDRGECADVMLERVRSISSNRTSGSQNNAEEIIQRHLNAKTPQPHSSTCVMLAVKMHRTDLVKKFVTLGGSNGAAGGNAAVDCTTPDNSSGDTPLLRAISVKAYDIVDVLLDTKQYTPEMLRHRQKRAPRGNAVLYAALDGRVDIAKRLVDGGAAEDDGLMVTFNPSSLSVLHCAVLSGRWECVEYFAYLPRRHQQQQQQLQDQKKEKTTTPTTTTFIKLNLSAVEERSHLTPLHQVVQRGDVELCGTLTRLLLSDVRALNKQDIFGNTPLMTAIQHGHEDCATLMIHLARRKLNTECSDRQGCTALSIAAELGQVDVAVALIDDAKAEVNFVNVAGYTPLATAIVNGHVDTAEAIIHSAHATIDLTVFRPAVPAAFDLAFERGYFRICRLVLAEGVVCDKQRTEIVLAAERRSFEEEEEEATNDPADQQQHRASVVVSSAASDEHFNNPNHTNTASSFFTARAALAVNCKSANITRPQSVFCGAVVVEPSPADEGDGTSSSRDDDDHDGKKRQKKQLLTRAASQSAHLINVGMHKEEEMMVDQPEEDDDGGDENAMRQHQHHTRTISPTRPSSSRVVVSPTRRVKSPVLLSGRSSPSRGSSRGSSATGGGKRAKHRTTPRLGFVPDGFEPLMDKQHQIFSSAGGGGGGVAARPSTSQPTVPNPRSSSSARLFAGGRHQQHSSEDHHHRPHTVDVVTTAKSTALSAALDRQSSIRTSTFGSSNKKNKTGKGGAISGDHHHHHPTDSLSFRVEYRPRSVVSVIAHVVYLKHKFHHQHHHGNEETKSAAGEHQHLTAAQQQQQLVAVDDDDFAPGASVRHSTARDVAATISSAVMRLPICKTPLHVLVVLRAAYKELEHKLELSATSQAPPVKKSWKDTLPVLFTPQQQEEGNNNSSKPGTATTPASKSVTPPATPFRGAVSSFLGHSANKTMSEEEEVALLRSETFSGMLRPIFSQVRAVCETSPESFFGLVSLVSRLLFDKFQAEVALEKLHFSSSSSSEHTQQQPTTTSPTDAAVADHGNKNTSSSPVMMSRSAKVASLVRYVCDGAGSDFQLPTPVALAFDFLRRVTPESASDQLYSSFFEDEIGGETQQQQNYPSAPRLDVRMYLNNSSSSTASLLQLLSRRHGVSPLHVAVLRRDFRGAAALLRMGADPFQTLLHLSDCRWSRSVYARVVAPDQPGEAAPSFPEEESDAFFEFSREVCEGRNAVMKSLSPKLRDALVKTKGEVEASTIHDSSKKTNATTSNNNTSSSDDQQRTLFVFDSPLVCALKQGDPSIVSLLLGYALDPSASAASSPSSPLCSSLLNSSSRSTNNTNMNKKKSRARDPSCVFPVWNDPSSVAAELTFIAEPTDSSVFKSLAASASSCTGAAATKNTRNSFSAATSWANASGGGIATYNFAPSSSGANFNNSTTNNNSEASTSRRATLRSQSILLATAGALQQQQQYVDSMRHDRQDALTLRLRKRMAPEKRIVHDNDH